MTLLNWVHHYWSIFLKVLLWLLRQSLFVYTWYDNIDYKIYKSICDPYCPVSGHTAATLAPPLSELIGQNLSGWHLFLTISYQCPLQYLCLSVRTQDQRNNLTLTHLLSKPGWHPALSSLSLCPNISVWPLIQEVSIQVFFVLHEIAKEIVKYVNLP